MIILPQLLQVEAVLRQLRRRQIIVKKAEDMTGEMNIVTGVGAEAGVAVGVVVVIVIETGMNIGIAVRGRDEIGTEVIETDIERGNVTGTDTEAIIEVTVMGEGGVQMAGIGIIGMTETVVTIVIAIVVIVTTDILRASLRIPKNLLQPVSLLPLLITNLPKNQMKEVLGNRIGHRLLLRASLDSSV